jgi:cobalt-zinc-cadmium efflux system protein
MPHRHEHGHTHTRERHHNHGHSHSHSHTGDGNIGVAFFLNLIFTVIELIGGLLTNSVAIISDAVHDLGDSVSLGLSWYFQKLSKKGGTAKYTYGYQRFSLLGAIVNSVVLVVGSVLILIECVPRFMSPQQTNAEGMFILSVLGIVINGAAALRTRNARSLNERVVSLHLLEDVLGWAAVLIGSVIIKLTGLTIIDPVLSVVIACFVLVNVFKNIRQVLPILLQGTPSDIDHERVAAKLSEIKYVGSVHDLHIWSLDETYNVLTVHIALTEALPDARLMELKNEIRAALKEENIQHETIEFETPDEVCAFKDCIT